MTDTSGNAVRTAGPGAPAGTDGAHGRHAGASVRTYIGIGALLAAITVIEWQLPAVLADRRGLLIGSLAALSGVKALLVAMYFMHLRFDHRIFTWIMLLALGMVVFFVGLATLGQIGL